MPFLSLPSLPELLNVLVAFLIGLAGHEYAHALTADWLGDHTARRAGRLTLNPLAHIDIIGLIAVVLVQFGWAKPVPVNPFLFKGNRRAGIIAVSLAGPLANLILAFPGALIVVLLAKMGMGSSAVGSLAGEFVLINVMLAVFNMIPIPPLDGSRILGALLPARQEWWFTLDRYGPVILIVALYLHLLNFIWRPINFITGALVHLSYLISALVR